VSFDSKRKQADADFVQIKPLGFCVGAQTVQEQAFAGTTGEYSEPNHAFGGDGIMLQAMGLSFPEPCMCFVSVYWYCSAHIFSRLGTIFRSPCVLT
jgi:hypothetical protein